MDPDLTMVAHPISLPWEARRQRGAALLLTLLILMAISLLGVTALRASLFSARIATGAEIDAMAFAGAESAIDATLRALENQPGRLRRLLDGEPLRQCVTLAVQHQDGACGSGDHLDSRALVVAASRARRIGYRPVADSGTDTSDGEGPAAAVVEYRIAILGEATIARFGRHEYHLQEAVIRKPGPTAEVPVQGSGLHRSGWRPLSPAEAEAWLASDGGG